MNRTIEEVLSTTTRVVAISRKELGDSAWWIYVNMVKPRIIKGHQELLRCGDISYKIMCILPAEKTMTFFVRRIYWRVSYDWYSTISHFTSNLEGLTDDNTRKD